MDLAVVVNAEPPATASKLSTLPLGLLLLDWKELDPVEPFRWREQKFLDLICSSADRWVAPIMKPLSEKFPIEGNSIGPVRLVTPCGTSTLP
jgi:hypothetical protein